MDKQPTQDKYKVTRYAFIASLAGGLIYPLGLITIYADKFIDFGPTFYMFVTPIVVAFMGITNVRDGWADK